MYASRDDMVLRYGLTHIAQLERNLTVNESVQSYIQDASDIADGFIGVAYTVPLEHPPKNLTIYICDIARYLLHRQQAPDEVRQRYEDAIAFLKRVADGKATLLIKREDTQEVTQAKKVKAVAPLGTTYRGGVFGDDILNNMPSV
ncbi:MULTISPECIES: gp436 family protein [Acinetobacter]|uniref:DUF1320 domain-containing protein n=1 Tax=Acinetobacter piscicola TaxID=2006115 RepID=A0A7S6VX13_9GAMM|nr:MULTISPECIES: DUF1320 domain-containing protein [Acinetobacter]QOW46458.1 DUF1320 domain-containing protein [Acinetobacter piscicola]